MMLQQVFDCLVSRWATAIILGLEEKRAFWCDAGGGCKQSFRLQLFSVTVRLFGMRELQTTARGG